MIPIIPEFSPTIELHKQCSFYVIGEQQSDDGRSALSSGIAATAQDVPEAICKAMLGFPETLTQGDLEAVEAVCKHMENPAMWFQSTVTGLPILTSAGLQGTFSDGVRADIIIRVMALVDGQEATAINSSFADLSANLLDQITQNALVEYAVPFAGFIDAMAWPNIVDQVLSSDRASVVRLVPEGTTKDIAGFFVENCTNADDEVACEISYAIDPVSDEANEIVRMFDTFETTVIRRDEEGVLFIAVKGKKSDIASALDWTADSLIGIRTAGVCAD